MVGKGKAWTIHRGHTCVYGDQHRKSGSAVYQLDHVQTAYPVQKEAIIVDEMSLGSWIRQHAITPQIIQDALASPWSLTAHGGLRRDAERFLENLRKAITQAQRDQTVLTGKALFEALQRVNRGRALGPLVRQLMNDWKATELLPNHNINPDDIDAIAKIESLPPVILPLVLRAFVAELDKWEKGTECNSSIRISNGKDGWALYVLEPRQFPTAEDSPLPPWAMLDATADKTMLELLTEKPVEIVHKGIVPPPNMRHIAVRPVTRNGGTKRYSKYSMVGAKSARSKEHAEEYRKIVAAEILSLLRELDPTGELRAAGRVGLITFQDCEQELAEAVGIQEGRTGHFGAIRGSNRLEGCEILFVVGTYVPKLDQIEWQARMLYRDDPTPIDTTTVDENGRKVYKDRRLRDLTKYLSHAELTQCAHRNRPLRYDGRVVVTMCVGEIADLPATETITEFPQLTEDGLRHDEAKWQRDLERLERAWSELVAEGVQPSQRKMRARFKMRDWKIEESELRRYLKSKRAESAAGLAA